MNNFCKRKCYWNYNSQCVCDNDSHYKDGTAHTSNCSEFLVQNFENKLSSTYKECVELLCYMNLKQLRQIKHLLLDMKNK